MMLGFNGGRIGKTNTVFTGIKSDDPNYSSVSLLLHGDGTNGSTTFTDSSSYGHTVTPVGNAQISTAQSKFGGASMYFDGSGDYLTLTNDASFVFGTGDFTVEMWVYHTSQDSQKIYYDGRPSSTNGAYVALYKTPQNKLALYVNAANRIVGTTSILQNAWYHIAVCRQGSSTKLFLNGIQEGSTFTDTTNYLNGTSRPIIGADGFNPSTSTQMQGYIDDLRITKGVARYTSNFTPPTAELPGAETGTFASGLWTSSDHIKQIRNELWPGLVPSIVTDGLVLHLDAGDSASYPGSGTTWYDLTTNSNNGTINGATYSSNESGYLDFDGVNDYVNFASNILTSAATEISCFLWVYPVSDGVILAILGQSDPNNPTYRHSAIEIGSSGQLRMSLWHNSLTNRVTSTLSFNTWNNIGFTYSGTTLTGYVNGSSIGTTTLTWVKPASIYFGVMAAQTTSMGTSAYGDGNVSAFYTYNKALTPSEITQNFDALKSRYGL